MSLSGSYFGVRMDYSYPARGEQHSGTYLMGCITSEYAKSYFQLQTSGRQVEIRTTPPIPSSRFSNKLDKERRRS